MAASAHSSLHDRLHAAAKRREELQAIKNRKTGALEQSRKNMQQLREKCREKNIDPDNIDGFLAKLHKAYREKVEAAVAEVEAVEAELAPFIEGDT